MQSSAQPRVTLWPLKAKLAEIGRTQKDLAREIGVTEATVSRWVQGHLAPAAEHLAAVLLYLRRHDPSTRLDEMLSVTGIENEIAPAARGDEGDGHQQTEGESDDQERD